MKTLAIDPATLEDVLPDEVKRLGFAPDHLATARERGARALCGAGLTWRSRQRNANPPTKGSQK